jgi:hypothetical protein
LAEEIPMRATAILPAVALGLVLASSAQARGTAPSLDIQPDARENGIGAAGVALLGDPADALWWNPAAMGFAEWHSVRWTRATLIPGLADLPYNHVAAAVPVGNGLRIGTSGTFLSYGESFGFEATEWSWAGAAGYRLVPDFALGLTVKYVRMKYAQDKSGQASGLGFDVGGLYRRTLDRATISGGLNFQNLGPEVDWGDHTDPLGRNLKAGVAFSRTFPLGTREWEIEGTAALDYNQSLVTHDFQVWNGGAEVRAGYGKWASAAARLGYYDDHLGEIQDLTWGGGVGLAGLTVDYAAIPEAKNSGLPRVEKWSFGFNTDLLLAGRSAP